MSASGTSNFPFVFRVVDIIPHDDSIESNQNSEPSIAVNPVNPMQMFAGSFGPEGSTLNHNTFFLSTDGGATWSSFGTLDDDDKSIAWKTDGSAILVTPLLDGPIDTYSVTVTDSGFGSAINHYVGSNNNDQPWVRTGPSDHVYVAFNDLGASGGKTASVNVSVSGGTSPTTVTLDRIGGSAPGAAQDDPAVRLAVNGSRVYAVFDRWTGTVENDANGQRYNSQLVIVRSDNGGADGFTALGGGGNGVTAATHIGVFADAQNTPLTIGQERIAGGDIAIAVDPNNANHVVVAYTDAPGNNGAGVVQLVVTESFNGGVDWTEKVSTPSSSRSGQPGIAILANGAIGLLYNNYDPATDQLSQHLLTTTDDFATTNDVTLATESNSVSATLFDPYQGDFFDLGGLGNTFYGIFSASNADDGTNALFTNTTFDRRFVGTPGTSSFRLVDASGNAVPFSIDPFFFSLTVLNPAAPPGVSANMVLRHTADGQYEIYNLGNNSILAAYWLGQVGTDWGFVTLGGFSGNDTSDMMLRNSTTGAFQVYDIGNNNITSSAALGTVGLNWQVAGFGDFASLGETDMILRDSASGGFQVYDIANNQITASAFMGTVGLNWQVGGFGSFSSSASSGMILRDANTGGLQVYDISNNQFTNSASMGAVGLDWRIEGFGNFSSRPGETDMLMRNTSSGELLLYDIANNAITGANFLGPVGLDWLFAGVAPIQAPGTSDLVLRNANTGQFQVYNIANNQITGSASLGQVGLDWQLGGFAPATSADSPAAAGVSQLVQAMSSFSPDAGPSPGVTALEPQNLQAAQTLATQPFGSHA
jgi:hypothetical protein